MHNVVDLGNGRRRCTSIVIVDPVVRVRVSARYRLRFLLRLWGVAIEVGLDGQVLRLAGGGMLHG